MILQSDFSTHLKFSIQLRRHIGTTIDAVQLQRKIVAFARQYFGHGVLLHERHWRKNYCWAWKIAQNSPFPAIWQWNSFSVIVLVSSMSIKGAKQVSRDWLPKECNKISTSSKEALTTVILIFLAICKYTEEYNYWYLLLKQFWTNILAWIYCFSGFHGFLIDSLKSAYTLMELRYNYSGTSQQRTPKGLRKRRLL